MSTAATRGSRKANQGQQPVWRWARIGLLAVCLPGLAGCASTHYYWQAVRGHLDLMSRRRPIPEVIADPATPARLRDTLRTVQALRRFAVSELALPDNGSYRSYAALDRPYVIWNVFAAPPLSIQPREWCFPVAGCVAYRGYFRREDAEAQAAALRAAGDDTYLGGVPAYSTLGWLDDPVLSTFIHWPEVELARLLFHELAHQLAYAPGDTTFNESFATSVEEEGVVRWIKHAGRPELARAWDESQSHRAGFLALVLAARADLAQLYASGAPDETVRIAKAQRLAQLQSDYQARKTEWGGFGGYDHWFGIGVNNAQLASVAVYTEQVPAFRALLQAEGGDLRRFYHRVRALAAASAEVRQRALSAALSARGSGPPTARAAATTAASPPDPAQLR